MCLCIMCVYAYDMYIYTLKNIYLAFFKFQLTRKKIFDAPV